MPFKSLTIDGRMRSVTELTQRQFAMYERADYIDIQYTELTELPELHSDVLTLNCQHNQLTRLPELVYCDELFEVKCSYNRLESLPELPVRLNTLYCDHNELTELPPLEALELECHNNKLTHLPPLRQTSRLICSHNELTEMPIFPVHLEILECNYNYIETLDLRQCIGLERLNCRNNRLTHFPQLPDGILKLSLGNNPFMKNAVELKKYKVYIQQNPNCLNDIKKKSNTYRSKNGREPMGQSTMTRKDLLKRPRKRPVNTNNKIHEHYDFFGRRGTRYRTKRVRPQPVYKYPFQYPQATYKYVNSRNNGLNVNGVVNKRNGSPPLRSSRSVELIPVQANYASNVRGDLLANDWNRERERLGFPMNYHSSNV